MRYLALVLTVMLSMMAHAGEEDLIKAFFGKSGIKDKKSVYAGEMLDSFVGRPTMGQDLPKDTKIDYRPIERIERHAVYAVSISSGGRSQDWYAYLVNEADVWKLSAVRTLALPGLYFAALNELSDRTVRSREEEAQYQNMLLTIKTDAELKEFFQEHTGDFTLIAKQAVSAPEKATDSAKAIHLGNVKVQQSGIIDVSIGGILDNSVGYLYVPEGSTAPTMTADEYIYVERIGEGWYLYKTT